MPKAKTLDRLELTRKKMEAFGRVVKREEIKNEKGQVVKIITEYEKEIDLGNIGKKKNNQTAFQEMRDKVLSENPELAQDEKINPHVCPHCGSELTRFESCYRCKKCGWAKC